MEWMKASELIEKLKKLVEDMTKAEKDAMIAKYEARGYKCVIIGYNDKENQ